MNLRVAIVGAGRMGRERARASATLGATVSIVCDAARERAAALAANHGAAAISRLSESDFRSVDAVFICTPPSIRKQAILPAIADGKPVFVEKPLALNMEQAMYLIEALQQRPVINAVGYMNRYRNSVAAARREVQFSAPIGIVFHWFARRYSVPWWLHREESGGPVNEQCTHYIDLCRYLIGEVAEVQALGRYLPDVPAAEGSIAIGLRFKNGLIGSGFYSCEASQKQMGLELFFPNRSVQLSGWNLRLDELPPEDVFVKETAAFFRAVETSDPSPILSDFASATSTQAVIDAICRATSSGSREPVISPREVPVLV